MKFKPNDRIIWIPKHARGETNHQDRLPGWAISGDDETVMVVLDQDFRKFGPAAFHRALPADELERYEDRPEKIREMIDRGYDLPHWWKSKERP